MNISPSRLSPSIEGNDNTANHNKDNRHPSESKEILDNRKHKRHSSDKHSHHRKSKKKHKHRSGHKKKKHRKRSESDSSSSESDDDDVDRHQYWPFTCRSTSKSHYSRYSEDMLQRLFAFQRQLINEIQTPVLTIEVSLLQTLLFVCFG